MPPTVMATLFPITCAQTMVSASHWVGFTWRGHKKNVRAKVGTNQKHKEHCVS
jgi:hypothetical protein